MKEINQAYDAITKGRTGGSGGGYTSQSYSYGGSAYQQQRQSAGGNVFAQVRQAVNRNDLDGAEQLLQGVPSRNGEWYFLMGSIAYRRGWLDEARQNYQIAVRMDPNNMEYRQALGMMQRGGYGYQPDMAGTNCDAMDCCTAMMCMNCMCGGCR